MAHFTPALFTFLRDLKRHNDRAWFNHNKARYEEQVKEPALRFVADFAPHLAKISKHLVADPRPVGGSLFRIHRDTRFAKDKTPYKTSVGIHFRHRNAKDAHAPGLYLHLDPGECFFALGLWMPETAVANRIRGAIVDDPKAWTRVVAAKAFSRDFELGGEKLKRPPAGIDKDHPLVEDLKRKSFIASTKIDPKSVTRPGFIKEVAQHAKTGAPLVKFLCGAIGASF
jgi:uncharacterized protein (TIGR02453 family)